MTNVTYLLGAGASANALPTNKTLPGSPSLGDSFIDVANDLLEKWNQKKIPQDKLGMYNMWHSNLHWLQKEAKRFATIDTYAKYLYAKKDRDTLIKLKKT